MRDKIIEALKNAGLLKRVCLSSLKQNQEGYFWIELKSNYYNKKSAIKVKNALKGISNFYIKNPEYEMDRVNNCYVI